MSRASRPVVVGTRISRETKERLAALAARQGLSESCLLALVVDKVVGQHIADPRTDTIGIRVAESDRAPDRFSLRLRPGDRALAEQRAAARGMRTASYLSMLIRAHVRGVSVMPPHELDQLRVVTGHLSALGRQLRMFGVPNSADATHASALRDLLADIRTVVEAVRESTAAVVRRNLISWEAGND